MTVSMYQGILLCAIFLFEFLSKTSASGVFQLKLLRFVNDEGVDESGRCCGSPSRADRCPSPCRTSFRVCLTHFQSRLDTSLPSCTFGNVTTPVLGLDTFSPSSSQYIKQHPIEFHLHSRWPGYFSLVIDVMGKRNMSEQERLQNRAYEGSNNVLLSRVVKSEEMHSASGDSWRRPSAHRHRNTALHYAYRLVCNDDSYGPFCSVYCRARNDTLGHYKCNEQGQKVCLPGWTNKENDTYCTKAICTTGCNETNGKCIEPNVCKCKHGGWMGDDCSQCRRLSGCVHGTCAKPYECNCVGGWGGTYCNQDLHYCVRKKPCRNGGTCHNGGKRGYTCQCSSAFTGRDCEIEVDECASNPCQGNATCVDLKDGYHCLCPENTIGLNCQTKNPMCSDTSPCLNGGTCRNTGSGHICDCATGWRGEACQIPVSVCSSNPCRNGGICRQSTASVSCLCKPGYAGKRCERHVDRCRHTHCLNGGLCSDRRAGYSRSCSCRLCLCPKEYSGDRCEHGGGGGTTDFESYFISKKDLFEKKEENLTTAQWVAVCFGAGSVVVLLAIAIGYLLLHRRRIFSSKRKIMVHEQTLAEENKRRGQTKKNPPPGVSHRDRCDDDERRLSLLSDGILPPLAAETINERKVCEGKRSVDHLKRLENDRSDLIENDRCLHEQCQSSARNASTQNRALNESSSGLPTYEEACREDNMLLQCGSPPHLNSDI